MDEHRIFQAVVAAFREEFGELQQICGNWYAFYHDGHDWYLGNASSYDDQFRFVVYPGTEFSDGPRKRIDINEPDFKSAFEFVKTYWDGGVPVG